MNTKPAIQLKSISLSLGKSEILKDIDLEIDKDEFTAIVGPSGCGKTMLLNLMAGYLKPSAGEVIRNGSTRRIYQQGGLLPWLTVKENVALGVRDLKSTQARKKEVQDVL